MSDVDGVDVSVAEIFFLEGEYAAEGVDGGGDFFDAPGSGGPDLGGDVIADGDSFGFGDGGDAEVDSGGVDRDDDVGFEGAEFAADFAEEFPPVAHLEDGTEEHGGTGDGVGEEPAPRGGHAIAADADEVGVGETSAERGDE